MSSLRYPCDETGYENSAARAGRLTESEMKSMQMAICCKSLNFSCCWVSPGWDEREWLVGRVVCSLAVRKPYRCVAWKKYSIYLVAYFCCYWCCCWRHVDCTENYNCVFNAHRVSFVSSWLAVVRTSRLPSLSWCLKIIYNNLLLFFLIQMTGSYNNFQHFISPPLLPSTLHPHTHYIAIPFSRSPPSYITVQTEGGTSEIFTNTSNIITMWKNLFSL